MEETLIEIPLTEEEIREEQKEICIDRIHASTMIAIYVALIVCFLGLLAYGIIIELKGS